MNQTDSDPEDRAPPRPAVDPTIKDSLLPNALGSLNEYQQLRLDQAIDKYAENIRQAVTNKSGVLSRANLASQQGFVAEAHIAESYNVDAAALAAPDAVQAHQTTFGDPNVDITIKSSSANDIHAQVKFYKTGLETAKAASRPRYTDHTDTKVVPADQKVDVVRSASRLAVQNRETRPSVAKDYQDTANNASITIEHPNHPGIESAPLNRTGPHSSEELAKQARTQTPVEYAAKAQKQAQLHTRQYTNAVIHGAIGGLIINAAGELIRLLQRPYALSTKDIEQACLNVLTGSARQAGLALLTTGVQHFGRTMASHSAIGGLTHTIGKSLTKGNVAVQVAAIGTHIANDLYRLINRDIDAVEMAESTTNHICLGFATAGGFTLGANVASMLTPFVTSMFGQGFASATVLGASMGSLGPILAGIAGGALVAIAGSAYIQSCHDDGRQIAIRDLERSFRMLQNSDIDTVGYVARVGSLSELRFHWDDLLPGRGLFSIFGEYKVRKAQLKALDHEISLQRAAVPEMEREIMNKLRAHHQERLDWIDRQFAAKNAELDIQSTEAFTDMEQHLANHLSTQRMLIGARAATISLQLDTMRNKRQAADREEADVAAASHDVERMLEALHNHDVPIPPKRHRLMRHALQASLRDRLPSDTPSDRVRRFLATPHHT